MTMWTSGMLNEGAGLAALTGAAVLFFLQKGCVAA